jgi:hypothetical protein
MRSPWGWPSIALYAALLLNERAVDGGAAPIEDFRAEAPSVLETDAHAMAALEDAGLSFSQILGANGRDNAALAETAAWSTLLITLESDIQQLEARRNMTKWPPSKRFALSWLRNPQAHFELIGAVNRLDRSFLDPSACGEARLVYRLVLEPCERPPAGLPMTVSVVFPQPKTSAHLFGAASCAPVAQAWRDLPPGGAERVRALASLYAGLPGYVKVEINLQTFHGTTPFGADPTTAGFDDHAEYLLRTFERVGDALVPAPLVDTPRFDLDAEEKRALAAWIRANFAAIDSGDWVVPERFLAKRALSVTPRGFAREPNRVFKSLFPDGSLFADLPYAQAQLVKSPAGLLRRLDQGTCEGCHETRSVAGFHLLGENRSPEAHLDAVAVARSAHLEGELGWREAMTAAVAAGGGFDQPRPFAERRRNGPGRSGAHCALSDDPTFAKWTCARGLVCHATWVGDEVGACVLARPRSEIGEPCQDVLLGEETAALGAAVAPLAPAPCAYGAAAASCQPNLLGFPGGLCITGCTTPGATERDGELVCGRLPASGYENDCLQTETEPIEKCIERYLGNNLVKTCGLNRPCRDDYACARMTGLPPKTGVCVPTYTVYGLRIDGPRLDRAVDGVCR